MAPQPNKPGQQWHDGQKNYESSNEVNRDHARSDTRKNQYEDHEDQHKDDAKFNEGHPTEKMDFRDKEDNLEADQ